MALSLQIAMNSDETIFSSFSFYICKNIKECLDSDLEIVSYTDNLSMRPVFGCKSNFFMYYILSPSDGENNSIVFRYKSKTYSVKISNHPEIVQDTSKMSYKFGILTITSSDDEKFENLYTLFERSYKEYDDYIQNIRDRGLLNIFIADGIYWDTVDTRKPRDLDSIYLPKEVKDSVVAKLDKFYSLETQKIYDSLGIIRKSVFLFEGVAGTGKTSFIAALASKYGYSIATLYFSAKLDDNSLVRLIKNMPAKTWLLLEDMDYLFQDRKSHDTDKNMITLSGLLNCLDGVSTKDGFVCWLTTNNKQSLDAALIRPGRVDKIVRFDYAIPEQVQAIYTKFMGDRYSLEGYEKFQTSLNRLHTQYTTSLLQQYLLSYIANPEGACENIEDMKKLHSDSTVDNGAGHMYT